MNNTYHTHPTVNLALNYLCNLGCPINGDTILVAVMLFGETQDHEPCAADTTGILGAELLQRSVMAMHSGKRQVIGLLLPMIDGAHGSVHAIADEFGYSLPCRCKIYEGGNDD